MAGGCGGRWFNDAPARRLSIQPTAHTSHAVRHDSRSLFISCSGRKSPANSAGSLVPGILNRVAPAERRKAPNQKHHSALRLSLEQDKAAQGLGAGLCWAGTPPLPRRHQTGMLAAQEKWKKPLYGSFFPQIHAGPVAAAHLKASCLVSVLPGLLRTTAHILHRASAWLCRRAQEPALQIQGVLASTFPSLPCQQGQGDGSIASFCLSQRGLIQRPEQSIPSKHISLN